MYFMEKLNVFYEKYKQCERMELDLVDNKWPEIWRSGNKSKSKEDWKKDFCSEVITVYPQFKEYCLELQARAIALEEELRDAKVRNLELEEKLNGKKD